MKTHGKNNPLRFYIEHPGEICAGISRFSDDITIECCSGNWGGSDGEFAEYIQDCLKEWYDGAGVELVEQKTENQMKTENIKASKNNTPRWKFDNLFHRISCGDGTVIESFGNDRETCDAYLMHAVSAVNESPALLARIAELEAVMKDIAGAYHSLPNGAARTMAAKAVTVLKGASK